MKVEISIGEFIDKISILDIKRKRITDENKLVNVNTEFDYLIRISKQLDLKITDSDFYQELLEANQIIWDGEEDLRKKQSLEEFDQEFIDIANRIHLTNDRRADIKKRINIKYKSGFIEEKSHR